MSLHFFSGFDVTGKFILLAWVSQLDFWHAEIDWRKIEADLEIISDTLGQSDFRIPESDLSLVRTVQSAWF